MAKTLIPKMKKGCGHCPPARARAETTQAGSGKPALSGHEATQIGSPLIVPRRGYTPARPSCILCTEKHLGAAYVLLTEVRHGYAHRLRAIGHLHEAEDKSQQWPELHNAIRAARKAYQTDGTIPAGKPSLKALRPSVKPSYRGGQSACIIIVDVLVRHQDADTRRVVLALVINSPAFAGRQSIPSAESC